MSDLITRECKPCAKDASPMGAEQVKQYLAIIDAGWKVENEGKQISRTFKFDNYYQTSAFVNAVVWIAHGEDHHPDITFGYNKATVVYSTHAIGGLSENDFISAAKVDALTQ
ncbi:4a-hydroxytetrahydrobiopterin dehydratase [Pseudohongiella acticola]|jgi:4a-hydroxytetrahydrobiopterin dehydratase|uniref:4a-hydroxytetrahydrobiopterin dehydratase n=1 Tax=Pseudohongiella acticola TaxID=1524254 RepID=UPI0030EF8B3E